MSAPFTSILRQKSMASFRKRGNHWYAEVCKKGVRDSGTFPTKGEAKAWAAQRETEILNNKSRAAVSGKTVGDLFTRYQKEISPNKKGSRWEIVRLKRLMKDDLASVYLSDLSASDIALWRDTRLKTVSPASVNRELNLISSAFTVARMEWGWIAENPVHDIKRPPKPKPRDVRIDDDLVLKIVSCLGFNGVITQKTHLIAVYFLIALETAMRLKEICDLAKEDIHLEERFVTLRDSKNNDKRHVPLSQKAVELFALVKDSDLSVASDVASTLFRRYLHKTGIEGVHFHDSRHEALTRLARKLDVLDLARMVGHRDPRSLMIYYNATATEIAKRLD